MSQTMLPHYRVEAAAQTGEWLGHPEATGEVVLASEWASKGDTVAEHYDTYEHFPRDETGSASDDSETRAITIRWVS
jgi:hypothetical protein